MRRVSALIILLLLLAYPAWAALGFVQVQNNFNSALGTTLAATITSTGGNLLVAWVRHGTDNTSSITVSDSNSATWTQVGSNCNSTSTDLGAMWYLKNAAAVTSVTATFGASVNNRSIIVYEISGADATAPLDASGACSSTSSNVTSLQSSNITTVSANTIVLYGLNVGANQSGASWVVGTGFTFPNNNDATGNSSTNTRGAVQYEIFSSIQTNLNTTPSWASSANVHGLIAAFKQAGGAVTPIRHKTVQN